MSCNGCRVLRKGCSETCILRPCLQWIDSPESQGHATVFVAKFFGRAGLMSFISSVPHSQRPALFQSLLFEACGRTVNPVNGAVGLLWTGNWSVCQTAVETVLRGGVLRPIPEIMNNGSAAPKFEDSSCEADDMISVIRSKAPPLKRKCYDHSTKLQTSDLDLRLTPSLPMNLSFGCKKVAKSRSTTPSMNSEESGTTSTNTRRSAAFFSNGFDDYNQQFTVEQPKLLNLFS